MSLVRPAVYDQQLMRMPYPGDLLINGEVIPATDTTNTNLTITGAMLLNSFIVRNPAGVSNENLDTAANMIAAWTAGGQAPVISPGTSWRFRWINLSANVLTLVAAANTGLVLVRGSVPVSTFKEFLITVVNGTPATTLINVNTINVSAIVSGLTDAQLQAITPGMIVTNAVANLQGQTILGINMGAKTITMSGNANATGVQTINLSPVVSITGLSV